MQVVGQKPVINYIVQNKEFFVVLVSLLGTLIPILTFLSNKSKEQKQINFNRFHDNLMKGLSNVGEKPIGLDQQIAIIYELRNYPEYYPVIKRLLRFQITRWKFLLKENPHFQELINESEETIKFTSKNRVVRFLNVNH